MKRNVLKSTQKLIKNNKSNAETQVKKILQIPWQFKRLGDNS